MMRIVHGDSSNPSVISYYRKGAENHRIEIGPEVSALLHCNPLQKVVCGLTALDTLQVTLIDSNAFADSDVSSVLIHGNVARVGFDAFRRCHRLEHVDCRAWTLEADCFKRCCVLKTVVLGGQLGELPIGAFQFCNALQSITFPDTVHTIGPKAFYHCPSLSHIDLSGSPLAAINEEAFCNCESLKKFVIPRHVAQINGRAFRGCTSLECVEFERGSCIEYIDEGAFQDCRSLVKICLPGSLRNIEDFCFEGCSNLKLVIFEPRTPENDTDPTRQTRMTARFHGELRTLPEDLFVSSVAFYGCPRLYALVVLRPAWLDGAKLRNFSGLKVVYARIKTIKALVAPIPVCDPRHQCRLLAWESSTPVAITSSDSDDDLESYVNLANSPPHLSVGMLRVQEIVREVMYWCIPSFGSWAPCRREWVRTVMMVAHCITHRLKRDSTTLPLPVLPKEMWYMMLGFLQENDARHVLYQCDQGSNQL